MTEDILTLERWGRNDPPDGKWKWLQLSDGYWTPWHLAQGEVTRLRQNVIDLTAEANARRDDQIVLVAKLDAAERARDEAQAELAHYKPLLTTMTGGTR